MATLVTSTGTLEKQDVSIIIPTEDQFLDQPISFRELSEFLYFWDLAYEATYEIAISREERALVEYNWNRPISERDRQVLYIIVDATRRSLQSPRHERHVEETEWLGLLEIKKISRNSPLVIVAFGIPLLIVALGILSGGSISLAGEINIPSLRSMIDRLRDLIRRRL